MLLGATIAAIGCTSAIISGKVSRTGRPLLWKHRDTGTEHNFVERVAPRDGAYGYVALYNGGDSLLTEAWMGLNDHGLAIMNTASYNLAPDTAKVKDREGIVMSRALSSCATLADFENLLDTLPKPLGVQANFGLIDSEGNGAYYETDDFTYRKYPLEEADEGFIVRTNYSCSGSCDGGYGYIREQNARHFIAPAAARADVSPELLTDTVSRSFYHSLIGRDILESTDRYAVDQDFIPRALSSASIVIEWDADPAASVMWTEIGYPPASYVKAVTVDDVPSDLRPDPSTWRSPMCDSVLTLKHRIFDISRGSGPRYVNLDVIREITPRLRKLSMEAYSRRNPKK